MTPRQLDLAHEFCEKVSADDLLDYLGLAPDASPDEARAALKARRRKMQGMQSNPKFRDEARNLIRNFQALDAVLGQPARHVRDMAQRRESTHLPILEMTIRGVLTGGPLTPEQEAYLRSNAAELGVSAGSFDTLLRRLQAETSAPPDSGGLRPQSVPRDSAPTPTSMGRSAAQGETLPDAFSGGRTGPRTLFDFADDPSADALSEDAESGVSIAELDAIDLGDPASVLDQVPIPDRSPTTDPSTGPSGRPLRAPHNRANSRPPPPVRSEREDPRSTPTGPSVTSAATAPPVRERSIRPGISDDPSTVNRPSRDVSRRSLDDAFPGGMEIVDGHEHVIEVTGRKPGHLAFRVRLLGELPVAARVIADDNWVTVSPDRLSPTRREHTVQVVVHPERMFRDDDQTTVRLFNDLGEQVEVTIRAHRSVNWTGLFVGVFAAIGLATLIAGGYLLYTLLTPQTADFLVVKVDPTSEYILLDGKKIGSGQLARLEDPPAREHKLTVVQKNFVTHEELITLGQNDQKVVNVVLDLSLPEPKALPPDAEKGTISDLDSTGGLSRRLEGCVALTPRSFSPYHIEITLTVGRNGNVNRVRLSGRDEIPSRVYECLRRQGATLSVPPLDEGDYAELTFEVDYPPPRRQDG